MSAKEPTPIKSNGKGNKSRILQFRSNKPVGTEYFYSDCDQSLIVQAIDAATRQGAAVMFGRTSDGGAFSLLILDGDEKVREYSHSPDELADVLRAVVATYMQD